MAWYTIIRKGERTKEEHQMLRINYTVRMNGNYMNCFDNYADACELRANLERRFPMARITIEDESFYE